MDRLPMFDFDPADTPKKTKCPRLQLENCCVDYWIWTSESCSLVKSKNSLPQILWTFGINSLWLGSKWYYKHVLDRVHKHLHLHWFTKNKCTQDSGPLKRVVGLKRKILGTNNCVLYRNYEGTHEMKHLITQGSCLSISSVGNWTLMGTIKERNAGTVWFYRQSLGSFKFMFSRLRENCSLKKWRTDFGPKWVVLT